MQNKNQVTLGVIIIGLGVLFLIGDVFGLSIGRLFWPLFLIGIGAWMLWRPRMVEPGANVEQRLLGDVRREGAWKVEDGEFWLGIGDVKLDMVSAQIPLGKTKLRFYGFVGDIDIFVPQSIGVAVRSTAFVTSANVLGRHEDTFFVPYVAKSDNYDLADRQVDLEMVYFVSDVTVKAI